MKKYFHVCLTVLKLTIQFWRLFIKTSENDFSGFFDIFRKIDIIRIPRREGRAFYGIFRNCKKVIEKINSIEKALSAWFMHKSGFSLFFRQKAAFSRICSISRGAFLNIFAPSVGERISEKSHIFWEKAY